MCLGLKYIFRESLKFDEEKWTKFFLKTSSAFKETCDTFALHLTCS